MTNVLEFLFGTTTFVFFAPHAVKKDARNKTPKLVTIFLICKPLPLQSYQKLSNSVIILHFFNSRGEILQFAT